MQNWQEKTFDYEWLRRQAASSNHVGSMISWLKSINVVPAYVGWRRGMSVVQTNLDPRAIPAKYLAEAAYEWDLDLAEMSDYWTPHDTPRDFIELLSFEMAGEKRDIVRDITGNLGRERAEDEARL